MNTSPNRPGASLPSSRRFDVDRLLLCTATATHNYGLVCFKLLATSSLTSTICTLTSYNWDNTMMKVKTEMMNNGHAYFHWAEKQRWILSVRSLIHLHGRTWRDLFRHIIASSALYTIDSELHQTNHLRWSDSRCWQRGREGKRKTFSATESSWWLHRPISMTCSIQEWEKARRDASSLLTRIWRDERLRSSKCNTFSSQHGISSVLWTCCRTRTLVS